MKTVVFGGAFDPVHSEHVSLAASAVSELKADKLVLVPTFSPGHKSAAEASFSDRMRMLELAFSNFSVPVEISDVEYRSGKTNYTFEILPVLKQKYGEVYYLVGGDSLEHFPSWKHPEIILEQATLVADDREGFENSARCAAEIFEKYGKKVILLHHLGKRVSSGEIKAELYFSEKPKNLPQEVFDYVTDKKVYSKYDDFVKKLKGYLTEKRFFHTKCVACCAIALNSRHNLKLDYDRVFVAAALHDVGKYVKGNVKSCPEDALGTPVEHQFVGAYVAEHDFGITDPQILSAIACHTTGKANMSPLDKLVYAADVVSYERDYDGADMLRQAIFDDFEKGFEKILYENYLHVAKSGNPVYPLTSEAVRYYEENNHGN